MQDQSRSQSNEKKNKSMLSTQNISCNQSYATNFYNDTKANTSLFLQYANVPFQKLTPRWNQSSATWRHASHRFSFSRDSRFKDQKLEYSDIIEPQMPTTRSSKSCTFGKGRRRPISQVILRNAKQKPAPDRYKLENFDEMPRRETKGKSFGLSWKTYQKIFIDHRKDVYAAFQNQENPPAKYEVRESPGKQKRKFSMYGRLKMYSQKMADDKNWIPGPRYLIQDCNFKNGVGLHERNFGFGERMDLSKPANDFPGAKYMIPGFCSRFKILSRKAEGAGISQLRSYK